MGVKITALRPFVLDSQRVQAGDTLEVSADEARSLIHSGAAKEPKEKPGEDREKKPTGPKETK